MNFYGKQILSSVYGIAANTKNTFYDRGWLEPVTLPLPVLSVGNLSMGGTGKTPVVQQILKMASDRGLRAGVVARNYRAESVGVEGVDTSRADGAAYFGDEAFLTALRFPSHTVWTGPRKSQTAQALLKIERVDFVVVDDGFQHRKLKRNFDLVLLDASTSSDEDHLLPWGRLRESFASLNRASAVALTKVNWASKSRLDELRSKVPSHLEIYEIEFSVQASRPLTANDRVLLVSGIAKPQLLFRQWQERCQVAGHEVFGDHHVYTRFDAERIVAKMKHLQCSQILTTEKDHVKMQVFPELKEYLNPIVITTKFRTEPRGLYAFLDKSVRH